jgi:hypothetical protein
MLIIKALLQIVFCISILLSQSRLMTSPSCLCVWASSPPFNYWIPEGVITKLETYIVAYLLKARTVKPEIKPLLANGSETTFVSRQGLDKHVPAANNTRNNKRIVGRIIFYAVCELSQESLWACLRTPTVARQQIGKHVPTTTNRRNNRTHFWTCNSLWGLCYYQRRAWGCTPCPPALLGNNSVNTFPRR